MSETRFCPKMSGLVARRDDYGNNYGAAEWVTCVPNCAWRIGDDCAMVVLAKATQRNAVVNAVTACNTCEASENSDHPWCADCVVRSVPL